MYILLCRCGLSPETADLVLDIAMTLFIDAIILSGVLAVLLRFAS
jgi:hypothetical protein